MQAIIHQTVYCRFGNVHTRIGRSIVYVHFPVFIGNPTIGKQNIRNISYAFFIDRGHEISGRLCNHFGRILQRSHVKIEHIAQSGSTTTNPMSKMQPPFFSLNRVRTLSIFHFFNRMIFPFIDNYFVVYLCMANIIDQSPAYASTISRIDETVLRTGIKSIFPIHELGMQNDITLLAASL